MIIKTIIGSKNKYLMRSYEDLKVDMKRLAPRIQYLVQIVKDIINGFAEKRSRNVLDFSDYEHFALQILTDQEGNASPIAKEYRSQFEEILVDEYQDTNQVQEAIISKIKRGDESNGNLFMVGDVKQSIYKFRQAIQRYLWINIIVSQKMAINQGYVSIYLRISVHVKKYSPQQTTYLTI